MTGKNFRLKLRGKTAVLIDWANVYGWQKSLKTEVNPKKLYHHFRAYKEIRLIGLYHGTDKHEKSRQFLQSVRRIGFQVTTKPVKYILVAEVNRKKIYRRKCDFDMEICIDVHGLLKRDFQSFIFLTGDGDFEPLYQLLIKEKKQIVVIYAAGHLGREVWDLKKGIFKTEINKFPVF